MGKKVLNILKRICIAFTILYGFNLLLSNTSVIIPINIATLASVSALGMPGFLSLIAMFFITM